MGYGFKIGGRGIILRPCEIKIYDGETEIKKLTIEGATPTKRLRFTYIADNGKIGDGIVKLTTNSSALSVSQTEAQKKINEFTLTFNGMDVDEAITSLTLSVEETKHFLATETVIPITLKRSVPTITLTTSELRIVGGKPSGQISIGSYDGDGELTAISSDTEYATVAVKNTTAVAVTYLNGDKTGKSIDVTVGCKAGKFYQANSGVRCLVILTKSDPIITLNANVATIYGGGSSAVVNVTYSGLEGSMDNISDLKVKSDNDAVATATLYNTSVTIAYASAGATKIRVYSEMSKYYNEAEAVVDVTCAKSTVTIPSLTGTSFACVGNSVGPGVNNLNTNLVTQSGTLSTTGIGSYTVYWDLKDPNRYCWSDGTTARKSQNWSSYGGTITCYFQYTDRQHHKFAFTAAWNRWENYPGDRNYGYVDGNYKIGEYTNNGNTYVCWCAPKRKSFGTYYVSGQRVNEHGISNIGSDIGPVNGKTYTQ